MLSAIGQGRPWATAGCSGVVEWPVLEALSRYVSPQQIQGVLEQTGRQSQRIRKTPAAAVVGLT